jgi:hypothetical protein
MLSNRPRHAKNADMRRCGHCRQDLQFLHRKVSPARLGTQVVMEFYQCPACDAGYAINVGTGQWKPWIPDED